MRRTTIAMLLVLAAGIGSALSPAAGAATSARLAAATGSPGQFGVRLVDVPVDEANDPRAFRYVVDYLPTGTVVHRRILILNQESRTARLSVYSDAARITNGLFVGDQGATRSELTTWTSVQHPQLTLAPGASAMDTITIKVPKGATRGEQYGVIWVQQTARGGKKNGFGISEISRVGVRVYLAVGRGGSPPTNFNITSIVGRRTASGQSVIVAHVNNTGGRAIDLNGSARLTDGPGNSTSGPFRAQDIVTLAPGQAWDMTFAVPKTLPSGSWRATVRLVSGLTAATSTMTVQFGPTAAAQAGLSAMEWIWLAVVIFVAGTAAALVWYARQHRRRRAVA